jgi:hypothetical protein
MDSASIERYESLLYGRDLETPAPVTTMDPDPSSKPTESTPEVPVPTLQIQLSGFDWWVTDKDIEQCLLLVSSGLFQLVQLNLLEEESSGRFRGIVEALLRTEAPDAQIVDVVSRTFSEKFVRDDRPSRISVRAMPSLTPKPSKSQGPPPPPPSKF